MRPKILKMRGFITYKDQVEIDFSKLYDRKIFLISGDTGSGKTSIFDAISFALYGKVAREIDDDRLRCDFLSEEDPYTFVSLEFEVGDKTYLIERIPRQIAKKTKKGQNISSSVSLFELNLGEKKFISDKKRETDEAIKEIIGLDDKQFSKVMLLAQGQFQEFLSAKSTDKASLLGDIFKTYEYKDMQDKLKEASKDSIKQMDLIDRELTTTLDYSKEIKDLVDKDDILTHEFDQILASIRSGKEEVDKVYKNISAKEQKLDDNLKNLYKSLEQARNFNQNIEKYRQIEEKILPYLGEEEDNKDLLEKIKKAELAKNIYIYEKRYKTNLDDIKAIEKSLEEDRSREKEEEKLFKKIEKDYQDVNSLTKALDKLKIEDENISKTLTELENFADAKKSYLSLDKERKDFDLCQKERENLQTNFAKDREIFDLNNEILREITEKGNLINQSLQSLVENTRKLEDDLKKLEEIEIYKKEIEGLKDKKNHILAIEKKARSNNELAIINKMIDKLNDQGICPVCKTSHRNHFEKYPTGDFDLEKILGDMANIDQAILLRDAQVKKIMESHTFKTSLQELRSLIDRNYSNKKDLEDKLLGLREDYKKRKADGEKLKKTLEFIRARIKELEDRINSLEEHLRKSKDIEIKYLSLKEKMENVSEDNLVAKKAKLKEKIKDLADKIAEITSSYQKSQLILKEISSNIINKEQSIKDLEEKSDEYDSEFKTVMAESFASEDAYTQALARYDKIIGNKDYLITYFKDLERLRASLENYLVFKDKEPQNILELNQKIEDEASYKMELSDKKAEVFAQITNFERVLQRIDDLKKDYDNNVKSHKVLAKLSKLADGSFGKVIGREKIDFETFVLTFYFDKVLRLANIRFLDMTDNQFSMVRNSDASDLRSKAGLDIEILDANTGKLRPVATLSGGESFLASLSLALGLSDEISMENGGIRIDTLFIDEGFGTLSKDYLTNVITAIEKLSYEDKFIGLISHVDELKEAIEAKIRVKYEPNLGSSVEVMT